MLVPATAAAGATPGSGNSKCYAQGSLNPAQYTPGESAIPIQGMMDAIAGGLDLTGVNTDADDGVVTLSDAAPQEPHPRSVSTGPHYSRTEDPRLGAMSTT